MTDDMVEEIHSLATVAVGNGQGAFPVHIFPFRMTEAKLSAHEKSPWLNFWRDLKKGHDLFGRDRLPPAVKVCAGRYDFEPAGAGNPGSGEYEAAMAADGPECVALHARQPPSLVSAEAKAIAGPSAEDLHLAGPARRRAQERAAERVRRRTTVVGALAAGGRPVPVEPVRIIGQGLSAPKVRSGGMF